MFLIFLIFDKRAARAYFRHDVTRPWQDDYLFVSYNLAEKVISCEVLTNEITARADNILV